MNSFLKNSSYALLLLALVGCNNEKVVNLMDQRASEARQGLDEARSPAKAKTYNPLQVSDGVWTGNTSLRLRRGLPLPSRFEGAKGIAIVSGQSLQLTEIADMITSQTGIPVRVTAQQNGNQGASSDVAKQQTASMQKAVPISYEGPLSSLLDRLAGYYGLNWKYDGGSINFSRYETRVFQIESLPGTQSVKDGVKEATNSNSSSSSSGSVASNTTDMQQSSELKIELKSWDELHQTVTAILGGVGSSVIAPSNGTITVTTTPELMRTVAEFIEQENKRLSRQIAINVEIYTISLTEGTDFTVAFTETLKKVADIKNDYSFTNSAVSGGGTFGLAILNSKRTGSVTSTLSALTTMDNATRVAQFPMTTLNNRPVTRRVGKDHVYAASVSNSNTTNYTSSTITPGTVQEGVSLQVTPRLLDDGRILLQYSLNMTDWIGKDTFTSGDSSIEEPKTSTRLFVQQSLLKSGSTLVIGGYDDEQASLNSQGVGSAFNYLFGGSSTNMTQRAMVFIAITPQVLDVPEAEQAP